MNEFMNENGNADVVEAVPNIEKQEKFFEESKERMSKICMQIAQLEKIAAKRSVDYTPENVEKMFAYLESQLADCKKAFMARFEDGEKDKAFDFDWR